MANKICTFYPMHMHLHASHEPSASIGSHMSHAAELGIRHLWLTEHDSRMGAKGKNGIYTFSYQTPVLYPEAQRAGFIEDADNTGTYTFLETNGNIALNLCTKDGQRESIYYHSKGKQHCDALFSRLTILLDADFDVDPTKSGVVVEFILSAQPPTYQQARMRYYLGVKPSADDAGIPVQYLPMPNRGENGYAFPITVDAAQEIGGLDNAFCSFRLCAVDGARIRFRGFRVLRELNFEEVRQQQIIVADQLSKKWGVTPFVSYEITRAGHHKVCYSTKIPVIDYRDYDFHVTNEQAVEYVKSHGGIFSYNHPFTECSAENLSQEQAENIILQQAEMLSDCKVYGATLIEVGFPSGRDGFKAQHYLRLWDELSKNGIFITGDGDSDNHGAAASGWTRGNNFCTFVGLYNNEQPTEENFIKAFKRGSVWMGDPVLMRNLSLCAKHTPMGGVCIGDKVCLSYSSTDIQTDGYVRCMVNGKEVRRKDIVNGKVSGRLYLTCTQKYNFARIEVYSKENRLIGLTNPIYLVHNINDVPIEAKQNGRLQGGDE